MTRIFVPRDSAALSVGADHVAAAITREASQRGVTIELVRNGSRGMLWLETLVEVETSSGCDRASLGRHEEVLEKAL